MRRVAVLITLALAAVSCRPRQPAPGTGEAAPASMPPESGTDFASRAHRIRLTYPAGWSQVPGDDYILKLVPREASGDPAATSLSIDVPKLRPRIPGFLPLGMVVNGYIDDLKKRSPEIEISTPAETTVAGARARRVRSRWTEGSETHTEDAVLTVRHDRVYIFRANAPVDESEQARAALDAMLDNVRWE